MRYIGLAFAALLATGCNKVNSADELGPFSVTETRTAHCGDGTLLAAPKERKLVVYMRRISDGVLHWRQGDQLYILTYNPQLGEFEALGQAQIDMREQDNTELPACVISRTDQLKGTLTLDDLGEPSEIEGKIRYDFVPTAESNCKDLMDADLPIADELPCNIAYDFSGKPI